MSINELIVFAVVAAIVHRQRRIYRARPSVPKCPAAAAAAARRHRYHAGEPHHFLTKTARPLQDRSLMLRSPSPTIFTYLRAAARLGRNLPGSVLSCGLYSSHFESAVARCTSVDAVTGPHQLTSHNLYSPITR